MERKFELTCKHCRLLPFAASAEGRIWGAPIEISGKWLFENFTPPDKRLKTILELQVRHFHRANQLL